MRYVLLAMAVLIVPACSSKYCNDGDTHVTKFSSSYRSCNFNCVNGDKKGRICECRCAQTCPCWQEASHKQSGRPPAMSQASLDSMCPKCERLNVKGWNFCSTCGYKREAR